MTENHVEPRKLYVITHNVQSCENLLDLGAGVGTYLPYLAHRAKRVVAVEINKDLVKIIKRGGYELKPTTLNIHQERGGKLT